MEEARDTQYVMLGAHLPTNADKTALGPVGVNFAPTTC